MPETPYPIGRFLVAAVLGTAGVVGLLVSFCGLMFSVGMLIEGGDRYGIWPIAVGSAVVGAALAVGAFRCLGRTWPPPDKLGQRS